MYQRYLCVVLIVTLPMVFLAGCQTDSREQIFATSQSQLALRQIQSRAFDTTDREQMLRTVQRCRICPS
jgi:uncharacterized lipoprotein YajG